MKHRFTLTLSIILSTLFICGFGWYITRSNAEITAEQIHDKSDDFQKCMQGLLLSGSTFHENFELVKKNQINALEQFKNINEFNPDFKLDALQCIEKTEAALLEFKNTALHFNNSKNSRVSEISEQCIIYVEYGTILLEHYKKFITNPMEFITSEKTVNRFTKYGELFKKQEDHLVKLIGKAGKTESLAEDKKAVVRLQLTDEESKAMEKWKDLTITDMIQDAMQGDAAGLYMIGMCNLYGTGGFSINIEEANRYFAASATLGFAPGIDKIKFMYMEDIINPYLALVYANLTSSFGHSEFTMCYHNLRQNLMESDKQAICTEIEKIATLKLLKIYETMNKVATSDDKTRIVYSILFDKGAIVAEDPLFVDDYWENILKSAKS